MLKATLLSLAIAPGATVPDDIRRFPAENTIAPAGMPVAFAAARPVP